ncbi:MAG: ABC transporter ATP-binding protein [Acidobacteria bacterium]|nr:ABC transporter ATP-binding protein [Acidobacteriota bacterium]
MLSSPLLSVRDLSVTFDLPAGPAVAVDQVSFAINAGQTLGLVGESGSGKSVTALSIMRLLRAPGRVSGGHVHFNGKDLLALGEREMRAVRGASIGFVFQEPMTALDPVYTVGDQIVEALRVHGLAHGQQAWARALELLEAVRIPNAAQRLSDYPHQLSGGMRQRVCIAIAIACRPALLIADEPTTALDVTIQAEILDLLREMRRELGLALLLITHDLGVVAGHADHVAVMYAGRIVEHGPVRAVLKEPQHPYTQGLIASLPDASRGSALRPIAGSVPLLGAFPRGCTFHPRCPRRFTPCDQAIPAPYHTAADRSVRCFLYDAHGTR